MDIRVDNASLKADASGNHPEHMQSLLPNVYIQYVMHVRYVDQHSLLVLRNKTLFSKQN